jgi:GMP synthase (glutamine-hydrolysing)
LSKGIVVLDFGGQYAHLIVNRIRRLCVYAEILPPDTEPERLKDADGIVLSGGPSSVYASDRPPFNAAVLDMGLPLLGLCYGHQLLCLHLGGEVEPGDVMEYGAAALDVAAPEGILKGLSNKEPIWMSHRDLVAAVPPGFRILGATPNCPVAAMGDEERKIYGLQFHPEVAHTVSGMQILENFVDLCGCERSWTMESYIEESAEAIRRQIGKRKVFLLVSGGVDSTVCFLMLNRALGTDRVRGLHIDNGFMRKNETALVERLLGDWGFTNLKVVDASAEFLQAVEGVAEPEEKRKIIGEEFIRVRDRVLEELDLDPDDWLLGQGTLYTDTIESGGTAHAAVIKTHHNRVGVIEQLLAEGKVVEPLSQLYKDEVRELGEKLGLPHHLVWRHPFPGPGLAVRVLCVQGESGDESAAEDAGIAAQLRQSAASVAGPEYHIDVLPLRSVGVQGDGRTYAHPALVTLGSHQRAFLPPSANGDGDGCRGVATGRDGIDWESLEGISTAITNSVPQINRVVIQLGPSHKLNQKLKEGYLTQERLDLLRDADSLVMEALDRHRLMDQVTQMPTVLLPLSSDGAQESIVLRPITTDDFMTARFGRLPVNFLEDVTMRLLALEGVEAVYYDITHKPPGTVEWE